jgi:hypothetical protein
MPEPDLAAAALAVLRDNWRGGDGPGTGGRGGHTVPSRRLYPHQWSWDSAFTAIGWAHAAPRRARAELESLLAAQWADGRVPQIVFSPAVPRDAYFPGPDFWRARSPSGAETTGLVQPPVHARAAWEVHRADPRAGARFLRRVYPALVAQHEYLRRERSTPRARRRAAPVGDRPGQLAGVGRGARPRAGGRRPGARARRDLGHVVAASGPRRPTTRATSPWPPATRDGGYRDADVRPTTRSR